MSDEDSIGESISAIFNEGIWVEETASPTYCLMLGALLNGKDLKQILAAGKSFDINEMDPEGYTLLHHASKNARSSLDSVNFLIENGADINAVVGGCFGTDSLFLAAANDAPVIVQRLIDVGVDPLEAGEDGFTSMHFAVNCFHPIHAGSAGHQGEEDNPLTATKLLLPRYPALFQAKTKQGSTLLHLTHDIRLARLLIEEGKSGKPVHPNFILAKDKRGVTALEQHRQALAGRSFIQVRETPAALDANATGRNEKDKKLFEYFASYSEMPVGVAAVVDDKGGGNERGLCYIA